MPTHRLLRRLARLAPVVLLALVASALSPRATAQVSPQKALVPPPGSDAFPTMFFEQDGDIRANTMPGGIDWAGPTGTFVGGVIDDATPMPNVLFPFEMRCFSSSTYAAVLCQDPNTGSSAQPGTGIGIDLTQFSGTSNKNDDLIDVNTMPWTWGGGTSGQPQKNDLTNVALLSFVDKCPAGAPGCDGHRWVAFWAETRSTSGDSHFDLEFNQAGLTVTGAQSGLLIGNGPAGGRTLDDFIVSVDFNIGGSQPDATFRRWQDTGGGVYNYVQVIPGAYDCPCSGATGSAVYARTITPGEQAVVPGGPWGHFDKDGDDAANPAPLQMVEGAIDLTSLGVDFDPCSPDATAMFKTRSSSSFTSELKDFALLPFQLEPTPECEITIGPTEVCPGQQQIVYQVSQLTNIEGVTFEWMITGDAAFCPGTNVTSDRVFVCADPVCGGSFELWVTATSPEGCSSMCHLEVIVDDDVPPQITCPPGFELECDQAIPPPYANLGAFTAAGGSASDNCDIQLTFELAGSEQSGTCPTVITRTYRVTDDCGNTAECEQTITIDDTKKPTITCPGDLAIECDDDVPPPYASLGAFEAAGGVVGDNCDEELDFTLSGTNTAGSCPTVITRTYRVTDDCGNFAECTQTIRVDDTTEPEITCPPGLVIECDDDVPPPYASLAAFLAAGGTATDNCDETLVFALEGTDTSGTCPTVITRTYTVTDDCGNVGKCDQTITIDDTTDPEIDCPPDITVECTDPIPPAYANLAAFLAAGGSADDNCDESLTLTLIDEDDSGTCPTAITRTYRVTDDCGNFAECSQRILIEDTTPPTIECPPGLLFECDDDIPPPYANLAAFLAAGGSAEDDCDASLVLSLLDEEIAGSCPTVITRTYRVTDDCGNVADCKQTITVDDTTPPQVTCPPGIVIECDQPTPSPYPALPSFLAAGGTASDNCDESLTLTLVGSETAGTCPTVITRTYRVTDDCGNFAECTQTITIDDTTDPEVSCPPGLVLECDEPVPPPYANLAAFAAAGGSAEDNCDANLTLSLQGTETEGSCPTVITRTYRVTDDCGNFADCKQTITIDDTRAPEVSCPPGLDLECDEPVPPPYANLAAFLAAGGTASDSCDANLTLSLLGTETEGTCPTVITRTYRVTDDCGNFADCKQTLTVDDTKAPEILCPQGLSVECDDEIPAPYANLAAFVAAGGSATDACDADLVLSLVRERTEGTCPTRVTRTYRVTDDCGNSADCTQTITIEDTTKPEIRCPDDIRIECSQPTPAPYANLREFEHAGGSASDACDPTLTLTLVGTRTSGRCPTIITRTYRVTDDCGNYAECEQDVIIDDTTPPSIMCPPGGTIGCDEPVQIKLMGMDNCASTLVFRAELTVGSDIATLTDLGNGMFELVIHGSGTATVTAWALDACRNKSDACQITYTAACATACSPGYWKNHEDTWCEVSDPIPMNPLPNFCFPGPATKFVDAFDLVDLSAAPGSFDPNMTLYEAVGMNGGSFNQTLFHGSAALLNAGHAGVNFGVTTAQVRAVMQQAFSGAISFSQAHNTFAGWNAVEATSGCPLN